MIVRINWDESESRLEISLDQLASLSCLCYMSKCELESLVSDDLIIFRDSVVY